MRTLLVTAAVVLLLCLPTASWGATEARTKTITTTAVVTSGQVTRLTMSCPRHWTAAHGGNYLVADTATIGSTTFTVSDSKHVDGHREANRRRWAIEYLARPWVLTRGSGAAVTTPSTYGAQFWLTCRRR